MPHRGWSVLFHPPLLGISLVARETMAARSAQTSEKFTHVANRMLRGVLESKPRQVMLAEMKQALGWTLVALARDVISDNPAVARAFHERVEAARAADRALLSGRPALCHRALRRFWSI